MAINFENSTVDFSVFKTAEEKKNYVKHFIDKQYNLGT